MRYEDQYEDFDLVKRVQNGETEAFRLLVERYQKMIYNLCYRMLKHTEEAKDATQETFLKAYRALREFRHESSFKTWICRIATYECLNRARQQEAAPLDDVQEDDEYLQVVDLSPSPLELVERKEVQSIIHKTIDALPSPYKTAITLYHLHELSYEEIAEAMDIPIGTVKTYLFRARAVLKTKLKKIIL